MEECEKDKCGIVVCITFSAFILVESVDICSSRRIGNAPELRQLVSYDAHASFRLDPIGSVDYYTSNKSL